MTPPDFTQKSDTSLLGAPGSGYRFETLALHSADGLRRYRVYLGIPQGAPPAHGRAVLYALDGNALPELLSPQRLNALKHPPVLALIGYETDLRFDRAARARDYTPPDEHGAVFSDPVDPRRTNGGAADFLHLIDKTIRPKIDNRTATDPARQILWGHSYGGLFVLYTLLHSPHSFTDYIAADPSLWHRQGSLYRQYCTAGQKHGRFRNRSLLIEQSGRKRTYGTAPLTAQQAAHAAARQSAAAFVPPDAGRLLCTRLAASGLRTRYTAYPELDHGGLLPVSFLNALAAAGQ